MEIKPYTRILFLIALLLPIAAYADSDYVKKLSDMNLTRADHPYGVPMKNLSVTGEKLSVAGVTYSEGVGIQADCRIKINTMRCLRQFDCKVGLNDCGIDYDNQSLLRIPLVDGTKVYYRVVGGNKQFSGLGKADGTVGSGSVVFRVLADGKEVWNSGVMHRGEPAKDVHLSFGGISVLELLVEGTDDGISGDHADWIDATFRYDEIAPETVSIEYKGEVKEMSPEVKASLQSKISDLPERISDTRTADWLIDPGCFVSSVSRSGDGKNIVMSNGLVSRVFRIFPNISTINIENLMTGQSMIRAASTEGSLVIDGKTYPLGGLDGVFEYGYTLDSWLDDFGPIHNSFRVVDFQTGELKKRMQWNQKRWSLVKEWNISGKELTFYLEGPEELKGIKVQLHYAIYDGMPVISKWLEVENKSGLPVVVDKMNLEELSVVEYESDHDVTNPDTGLPLAPRMHVQSEWANTSWNTTYWVPDSRYTSQVNYGLQNPCLLNVRLPYGPGAHLADGETYSSFRNWIMLYDSDDRERMGLFRKRFRTNLAPWTTENPIFLHCTSTDPEVVRTAVDQCAETGYEMIILSFGSGLDMENESDENIRKFKDIVDYAHSKGIEIGGYSLLASRWISDSVDVINPKTGKRGNMTFGSSPCLSSEWGYEYFRKIKSFFEKTGMDVFEHDGSYSGDPCASTTHAHHHGLEDSQWQQRMQLENLYRWMRSVGIYMNVPDWGTILVGSNKCCVGYREVNWSLPRDRQIVLGRQNLFDGTWINTPSSGWTFTPLVQYHGGGAAATIEPLDEHLKEYKAHMIQNYGAGVQSCYRGTRLYDTDRTRDMVKEVIQWYKKYREILNSDVIHLRRPDGRDWDGFMHVNPTLQKKGLAMLFNPTDKDITRTITIPLYYTGLTKKAVLREKDEKAVSYKLDRQYNVTVSVTIPANGYNWITVE